MKKRVGHYKMTTLSWAPEELCHCINKYSDRYEAIIISGDSMSTQMDYGFNRFPSLEFVNNASQVDIIHYHNRYKHFGVLDKPCMIQYHSPYDPIGTIDIHFPKLKTVIAQYQALIREYQNMGCKVVRNIIDFQTDEYTLNTNYNGEIRVGYSPSMTCGGDHRESKGYPQTLNVFQRLKEIYPNVMFDVIHGVSSTECIKRKSLCNIIIDECVTSSYHRSGLEGLALGKLTICSLGTGEEQLIKQVTGSSFCPFENIWIDKLETGLLNIFKQGLEYITYRGNQNRKWMEINWHPKTIVKEFENLYDTLE